MEKPNDSGIEQPTDDVMAKPIVTRSEIGFGVMDTPWWVILLEGIIA